MTKKIIEYGFMGDEQGITYIINHKPNLINNKYKFYKVIEKVQQKKTLDEKESSIIEPKKVENKFIIKPEVIKKKDEAKPNIQNESNPNIQNEPKPEKDLQNEPKLEKDLQNEPKPENDNTQNNNLLYAIPIVIIILILVIYFVIPSSKPQFFGRSKI